MFSAYVSALRKCPNWNSGNTLAKALPGIERLTALQVDELVAAYNATSELRGCFALNGRKAQFYRPDLVSYINRLGARQFKFSSEGPIEQAP